MIELTMKNNRLLVKKVELKDVDDVVIYTNDQKHKSYIGEIVSHCNDDGYEIGDKIIFSEFAGEEVTVDGKKFIILDSENVWGSVKCL